MSDEITLVPLALIKRDGGTQIRAQVSMDVARDYAECIARGDKLPPIDLTYDGTDYYPSDGFHRLIAAELLDAKEIEARVKPGTRRDAILAAVGANSSHGYRRTNADKKRAVEMLVTDPEWSVKSDREIARLCHVGPDMVGRLRPAPVSVGERQTPAKREVTRGGQTFVMDTTAINRGRDVTPAAPETVASRGSTQLRTFLGELRQGANIESAAVVADISMGEARLHAEAEEAGEYADVVAIQPSWKWEGDQLTICAPPFGTVEATIEEDGPVAANDDVAPVLPVFDFAAAQVRSTAMEAIAALANGPAAEELAEMWAGYIGRGVPTEVVDRARAWLNGFADLFPAAEARRQAAINLALGDE